MKTVVSYEQISCDLCGQAMTHEPGKMHVDGLYIGEKCVTGVVDVSAVFIGEEFKCLCNNCRKEIMEAAIRRFT